MRNSFYHRGKRGKAEKLAAEIIKMHSCYHCGSSSTDPAHLFQRSSAATCTDLRLIIPLCREYHSYIDTHPIVKEKVARSILGDDAYDHFNRLSKQAVKVDWNHRVQFLSEIKQALSDEKITLEVARSYENTQKY